MSRAPETWVKKLRGGVLQYAAQATSHIDAEIDIPGTRPNGGRASKARTKKPLSGWKPD